MEKEAFPNSIKPYDQRAMDRLVSVLTESEKGELALYGRTWMKRVVRHDYNRRSPNIRAAFLIPVKSRFMFMLYDNWHDYREYRYRIVNCCVVMSEVTQYEEYGAPTSLDMQVAVALYFHQNIKTGVHFFPSMCAILDSYTVNKTDRLSNSYEHIVNLLCGGGHPPPDPSPWLAEQVNSPAMIPPPTQTVTAYPV